MPIFSQPGDADEKVVFTPDDMFESEDSDLGSKVCWLVPNAQKNDLEPILVTLGEGGKTFEDDPTRVRNSDMCFLAV